MNNVFEDGEIQNKISPKDVQDVEDALLNEGESYVRC